MHSFSVYKIIIKHHLLISLSILLLFSFTPLTSRFFMSKRNHIYIELFFIHLKKKYEKKSKENFIRHWKSSYPLFSKFLQMSFSLISSIDHFHLFFAFLHIRVGINFVDSIRNNMFSFHYSLYYPFSLWIDSKFLLSNEFDFLLNLYLYNNSI